MKSRTANLPFALVILSGIAMVAAPARAQETGLTIKSSLQESGAIWYDKEKDSARFQPPAPDSAALSGNRKSLEEAAWQVRKGAMPASGWFDWLSPEVIWMILGILLIVLVVIAFFILRGKNNDAVDPVNSPGRDDETRIGNLPIEIDRPAGNFRKAAMEAAARGDFRTAIKWLYSHTLVAMDRNSVIELRKGKTNREYLAELLVAIPAATVFRSMIQDFESVYFGGREASAGDFASFLKSADAVEALSATGSANGGGIG